MQHAISTAGVQKFVAATTGTTVNKEATLFSIFINWCDKQESSRMLWMAMSYLLQIGMALPCTLAAVVFWGNNSFTLWILACIINVPVLAINLAAQPTKITVPALFFAWTADLLIILYCAGLLYVHL